MAALTVMFLSLGALSLAAAGEGACDGKCAKTYDKCIGRDIFSLKYCCDPRDECVKFSKWYGQCRPKANDRWEDDWLGTAEDCRLCGVGTRVVGTEFNWEDNIYCEVTYLGDYNLQDCAKECSKGPHVACDRYNGDGNNPASCYGYSELFEGGCFMRVPGPAWDSWLTCPGNAPAVHPIGVADEAPATLSAATLEADIAADEATTATDKALQQRKVDAAAKARK